MIHYDEQTYSQAILDFMGGDDRSPVWRRDTLGAYLKRFLNDPENRGRWMHSELSKAIVHDSLMEFVRVVLEFAEREERRRDEAVEQLAALAAADLKSPGALEELRQLAEESGGAVNLEGYRRLLEEGDADPERVRRAMTEDCTRAIEQGCEQNIADFADRMRTMMAGEKEANGAGRRGTGFGIGRGDEEMLDEWRVCAMRYPIIEEIAEIMGREQESDQEPESVPLSHYMPQLLSPARTYTEIDGTTSGKDIAMAVPSELALMWDEEGEWSFYQKYASEKLQLFSSKPPCDRPAVSERTQMRPRPKLGPIILGIDTSGSMSGEPMRIAKSMMLRLAELAMEQRRKCFLVQWSERARALPLTAPGGWRNLRDFLHDSFSGGTDPTDFFKLAFNALGSDDFEMADVLVISDFEVPRPSKFIAAQIEAYQEQGTRFYGLQTGNLRWRASNPYAHSMDYIWSIDTD